MQAIDSVPLFRTRTVTIVPKAVDKSALNDTETLSILLVAITLWLGGEL